MQEEPLKLENEFARAVANNDAEALDWPDVLRKLSVEE